MLLMSVLKLLRRLFQQPLKCTRLRTDQRLFRSKGFLRRVSTWFLHVITLQTPGHLCLNTFPPEPKSGTARFVKVIIINRIVYTDVTDELFKNGVTSGVTLNEKAPRNSVRRYFVEIRILYCPFLNHFLFVVKNPQTSIIHY